MQFIKSVSKREMWFAFIGLVIGIIIGAKTLSLMVPDATHWISLYHSEKNEMTGEVIMENHDMLNTHITSEKQFVEEMIPHHEAAVVMAKDVLKLNPRTEVKDLAEAIIKTQNSEIKMMQYWLTAWKW